MKTAELYIRTVNSEIDGHPSAMMQQFNSAHYTGQKWM